MSQPCILIAEGGTILAADLCDTVKEAGFAVEGPHADIASAQQAFQNHRPDVAILDTRLDEAQVFAFAAQMAESDIPVILHSRRSNADEVQARFPSAKTLSNPCPPADMIAAVNQLLHIS